MGILKQWLGWLVNGLGIPGFVHDADYRSRKLAAHVKVRRRRLFTIVSVNGLDVYFRRLTGRLDGVGLSTTGGYTPVRVPGPALPPGPDDPRDRR